MSFSEKALDLDIKSLPRVRNDEKYHDANEYEEYIDVKQGNKNVNEQEKNIEKDSKKFNEDYEEYVSRSGF